MRNDQPFGAKVIGRWKDILPALGIEPKYLTGKHTSCPLCGGKDRFRFDNRDGWGTFYCTHCKSGDGVRLVMLKHRVDFKAAIEMIEPLLKTAQILPFKKSKTDAQKKLAMEGVWKHSRSITLSDPAGKYLNYRTGITEFPSCLRFVEELRYIDDPHKPHRLFPGMIARVTDLAGNSVNIHRTYLSVDGEKANVAEPKRIMEGSLPKGSAIRLYSEAEEIGVAEGIESAISASQLFGIPVWATVNSTGLTNWVPPLDVKKVWIFGDNDESYGGQAASYSLAFRIKNLIKINVNVRIPKATGWDWADVHKEKILGHR